MGEGHGPDAREQVPARLWDSDSSYLLSPLSPHSKSQKLTQKRVLGPNYYRRSTKSCSLNIYQYIIYIIRYHHKGKKNCFD
jgi:hypothetical protein